MTKKMVLTVDDNPTNLRMIEEALHKEFDVQTAPSGDWALAFLSKKLPDLILLDVNMPGMDGYQLISIMKNDSRYEDIPVVFLTADEDVDEEIKAFDLGAQDYIKKPIVPQVVLARVKLHIELQAYRKDLESLVLARTMKLEHTEDCILSLLANVAAYRDQETGSHLRRTTAYCAVLVRELQKANLPGYYISLNAGKNIVKSAKLHDIGKVAIPDGILLKPGKLTPEEFDEIKKHTIAGGHMIDDAIHDLQDDSFLSVAREIIIGHHEKWNGMGYPNGVKGDDISIAARIMAIADVYDALISARPYKSAFSHEKAVEIIYGDSGTHFDPTILEIAKEHKEEFNAIAIKYGDDKNA